MARRGGTGGRFPDSGRGNDPGRRGELAVVLAIAAALAPVVGGIAVPGGVGTAAGASTLVVDADGGGEYTTIQAAVDNASTGDVVEVRAGTYNESVTVNASITIRGPDAMLDGSGLNDSAGIVIRGGDPTIAGLTIRGYDFDGVLAFDGGFTLDGIVAVDNEQSGVDVFKVGSDDWTITGATLDGNGFDGLSVTDATGTWRVESATIRNNGDDGIDVDRENTSGGTWTVVDTTVANNAQNGVEAIATTADWTISGGRFSGNGDDGIDTGGSRGTWTVTGVRAVGNAENGIEAAFTTGDWRVENAEVVDSGVYGVTANTSSGNWTVTGTTIDGAGDVGLRATRTTGTWRVRDLTVSGTTVGVNAAGADRAWRVERFRASDVVLGIQTDFADGDWTVRDATITATVAGIDATDSNGAWRVVDTEITTGGFAGVYAFEADGAWTVGGTTIRDAENGIYAGTTGGDWTIRDSTLRNYTVGVNATNSTGAWAVGNSVLDAAGPNVTDVDGGEGGPTGDATDNWWGGTVAAPDPPDCTGNVDCSDPLSRPPGGGDGEDTGDANLSVSVGSATVLPGGNATVELAFEAGNRSLNRTGAFVAVDPPVAPDGWPFVGVTAERGIWNDRAFVVANVSADETVNASFTVAVPLDTPPGRYGITVLPSYVIGEDSTAVPPANATVTVDEPPVSLEGANITLPPGGRGRLNLTVTNNELSERFASVSIERLPANVSVVEYVAGGGIWLPGSGIWGGDVPGGDSAEPALVVEAYDGATEGTSTGRATVAQNGTTYDRAPLTVAVDRSAGPTPNVSLNVTVGTDTYIDRRFGVFTGTIPKVDRGENYSVAVNVTNAGPGEAERLRVSLSNPVPFSSLANYSADRGRWRPEPSAWTGDLPAGTTTVPRTTLAIDAFGVGGRFYQLTASARWSGETIANDTRVVLVGDLDEPVPRARLAVNDSTPKVGQPVRLDASASFYDGGDDSLLEYSWDYDGDPDTDETGSRRVVTSFASRGCYEVSVEVSVGSGFDRATRTVAVGGEDCGSDDDEDTPSAPDNRPPEAEFTFSPATPLVGEAMSFDASGSRDRDGFVTRFEWDLDEDGTVERTGKRLSDVELTADGEPVSDTVNVTLTVTDAEGATDSVTREVDFAGEGETPTARFDFAAQDTVIGDDPGSGDETERINVDETVVFDAGPSTRGQSEIISYEWSFSDAIPKFRLRESATGEVVQRSFPFPGTYEARLTVETLGGLTDTISRTFTVFPKDRGPSIVSVEFEKEGRLIKRIGLQQTVNVSIVPETENTTTATVEVTLPGGTTLDATKTADEPFETWTAEFAADDIATDEEPLRILAVDERGNTDRQRVGLDAVRPPNWWFALFGGVRNPGEVDIGDEIAIDETERQSKFGGDTYVLSSNQPLQRLLGIPPLEFTLVGDGPYSGTWGAELDFGLYAAEHTLRDAVTTFELTEKKGGIVVGVALTTPERYPDPDISVSRQGVQTDVVSASLAKFTFGGEVSVGPETEAVRLTELEATVLVKVAVQSPVAIGWTVQTPVGSVRLGLVPIVELTFGPRVEAIDGGGSTGLVRGLPLGLETVVQPKGRAEAGVNDVNLDIPKVGEAGVNAYGFGEIQGDFVYQLFPESERGLQGQPTYRYRIGAETCITIPTGPGQSKENCLEDTFKEGSGPVRVPESLGAKARPTTRDAAASIDEGSGRTSPRPLAVDAASPGSLVRLTNDAVADRTPAVTAAALPTAVWTAPAPGSESAAGLEVYAAIRRNGSWTRQRVTANGRADVGAAVGTAGDRRLAAWSRVRSNASGADDLPTDVVVAPATADGWTTPVAITDGRGLRLGVGVAGVETVDGPRWLVAWFEDADANLSTTSDRSTRYVVLDPAPAVVANGTIGATGGVALAADRVDGRFTLAAIRDADRDATVSRLGVAPNGTVVDAAAYGATNVTGLAAGPDRIAWLERRGTRTSRAFVAGPGGVERVPLGDARQVNDPELTVSDGVPVLAYRASFTPGGPSRLAYQARSVEGWSSPRRLSLPANLSVRQAAAAVNGTELLAVATASAGRTPADVFVRTGSVRSDLVVDATAVTSGPPTVGAPVTVRYTVRNTGPLTTAPTTVLFRNRTGPIRSARIGPLGPGDRAVGNATFRLDRAGSVTVAVDPTGGIPERNESNNVATAVGARPDLDVVGVVDRRAGDRLELAVVVRNRGPIPVGKVPFRVTAGNESVTATLDGLGAGRTWNRTVALNASRIPTSAVVEVVLDPDDRVNEGDETNNAFTGRVLRADVGVDGGVAVYDDPQGARAELAVRNSDTGAPTANLTLGTSAGSRTYRLELPAARGSEDAAFRVVSLAIPEIGAGGNLTLSADPRGIDADPTDNAARQRIARVESARNASAARLTIGDATGRLVNATAVIELTLRNPGNLTTGEVVTVSRGGTVRARQPVAVAPGTETVRLRTNLSSVGTYTVATATDSATVEVASALPGPPRDPDNDGLFEDVNGDGSANVIDVAVLLERFDRPAYQDAADRFDFTGDGRLNILDVAELLAAV